MSKKTIITVTGIRPDFIRMSEIFRLLDKDKDIISCPYPMKTFDWDKAWRRLKEKTWCSYLV